MSFIARQKVNIDGVVVMPGELVPSEVPVARCEQLVGRYLDKADGSISAGTAEVDVDVDGMTVAELEAFAADLGIDLPDGNKAEKLAAVKAAIE